MLSPMGIFCCADIEVFSDRLEHALGQDRRRLGLFALRRENDKFVAADSGDELLANRPLKPPRDGAEKFVADDVTEDVVSLLEIVEVDAEEGEAVASRIRLIEKAIQRKAQRRPVRQLGQRVVVGKKGDLLVPGNELGARHLHLVARLAETDRSLPDLVLENIEAFSHLAELVARVRLHRHDVDRGMRGLQIAAAERRHGL